MLGENHRSTIFTINALAELSQHEGKDSQAEALYTEALEAGRRGLGQEHPFTLTSMNGLAEVYRRQGRFTQAEIFFNKVLESRRHVLGQQHPSTLNTSVSLGLVRLQQQKYTEAESVLRVALRTYEAASPENWGRFNCQSLLGASQAGQGNYAGAESLLIPGYEGMVQREATIPVGERSALRDAWERIVKLYQDWGKLDKAAEWKQRLQTIKTQALH